MYKMDLTSMASTMASAISYMSSVYFAEWNYVFCCVIQFLKGLIVKILSSIGTIDSKINPDRFGSEAIRWISCKPPHLSICHTSVVVTFLWLIETLLKRSCAEEWIVPSWCSSADNSWDVYSTALTLVPDTLFF